MSLHVIPALEEEFGEPAFTTNMSVEVWNDWLRPGVIPLFKDGTVSLRTLPRHSPPCLFLVKEPKQPKQHDDPQWYP